MREFILALPRTNLMFCRTDVLSYQNFPNRHTPAHSDPG
jgi:hypothetical protein